MSALRPSWLGKRARTRDRGSRVLGKAPTEAQLRQARFEGAQLVLDAVENADAALATPWRMVKDAREAAARAGEAR